MEPNVPEGPPSHHAPPGSARPDDGSARPDDGSARPIETAELLSIGTELTTGGTRDTNAGDLARDLSAGGVWVGRLTALPDDLAVVSEAIRDGLARADLVVTTGGLGPTPDDLTREAISAAVGEVPAVDPAIEAWLRGLWRRRGQPFPRSNLKQAWLIPSASAIRNDDGTAPGWWVERPDGRVLVALPGPPREMGPMWRTGVLPRLVARGLGRERAVRVLRLAGIGESALADMLGPILHTPNPVVATYARVDAVDIRVSAVAEHDPGGLVVRSAAEIADEGVAAVETIVGGYVWGRDGDTWPMAIARALGPLRLAILESGTGGAVTALLGASASLVRASVRPAGDPELGSPGPADAGPPGRPGGTRTMAGALGQGAIAEAARRMRDESGADVVLAVRADEGPEDTAVEIAVLGPGRAWHTERREAFRRGDPGRVRIAIAAAAVLRSVLVPSPPDVGGAGRRRRRPPETSAAGGADR
jgi:nicotinamide-nucleotide amidase